MKAADVDSWLFSASCSGEEFEEPNAVQNWLAALDAVMQEEKLTKSDVAATAGCTSQYVSGLLKNRDKANPAGRLMDKVARKIGRMDLSSFIAFGAEKRRGRDTMASERRAVTIPAIVGVGDEGELLYSYNVEDGAVRARESELHKRKLDPTKLAVYLDRSNSLAPQYPEGTQFKLDLRETEPKPGGYYLVRFFGELVMRRIEFDDKGSLILHANNPTVGAVNTSAVGLGAEDLLQIIGAAYEAKVLMK